MYSDEVIKELKIGEVYTGEQIKSYIIHNRGNGKVISDDSDYFNSLQKVELKVVNIVNGYIHSSDSVGTYLLPNRKENIYVLKRV